ncbi:MAG: hypothetical protein HY762_01780 [Planctomycetes bacterium]|nr:hypothetical protein [Planctomycetota bacterium]
MEVQPDFRDLLALFNEHKVDYLIVGAYALSYYGAPRATGDIDLFVRPDSRNAQSILNVLKEFGFGSLGLTAQDFTVPDKVVQLGVAPVRVDILTSLTGISWVQAVAGRADGFYGDVPVHYIGKKELLANKRALGRKRDIADLEALGE